MMYEDGMMQLVSSATMCPLPSGQENVLTEDYRQQSERNQLCTDQVMILKLVKRQCKRDGGTSPSASPWMHDLLTTN